PATPCLRRREGRWLRAPCSLLFLLRRFARRRAAARALRASLAFDDALDLDRDVVRQRAHADRRARVLAALAEDLDEEVGAAVDHLRLVGEARHGIDHA